MKKYVVIFYFIAFLFQSVSAIDISRYRFHVMPETSYYGGIQSIAKDSLGRMWYTGPDAVFMYDGNKFYQLNDLVTINQPKVKWGYGSLIADKQGKLFLATNHGLLKFNYEQFSFDLIVPGRIRSVCQYDDARLYMLSGDSVLWYDKKNNRTDGFRLPEQKFFSKIMNLTGELYVSQESSLYKLKIQERQLTPFINFGKSVNLVTDALAYNGLYYYLTQRGGIYVTDAAGAIKRHIPVSIAGNQS